ncbi:MAG: S41 family peptidase, partial [Flavobacteriales bacterium]|nr:S41 family peptidase [Flavobacteriales bacterium]
DSIDRESLIDVAVQSIVQELDPHTNYFTSEDILANASLMEGNFEGIGVEFIIRDDTLMVVNAIPGGPSESAGIKAGDRIVEVEGESISSPDLTNDRVMKLLKGPRGTQVDLGIFRNNSALAGNGASLEERLKVTIERARIPIQSVVATFVLENSVGYIKVIRFSATTAIEFEQSMRDLAKQGATSVIVDLRGNGGGYLHSATDMLDRFLDEGLGIVYTEGKASPRINYNSTYRGEYSSWPIAVLIDENSASASEIFAGALQDNDRGLILGRRSFGKGLVQEEFSVPNALSGAGALRLTVARFYTPSGRAIQKPYGEGVNYANDYQDRIASGELFLADSIQHADTLAYRTLLGRKVYGGGGITPDVFIALDSTESNRALAELVWTGALRDASFTWVDLHRAENLINNLSETGSIWTNSTTGGLSTIKKVAERQGTVWPDKSSEQGREEIERIMIRFFAQVVRNVKGENAFHKVRTSGDAFIERALYELLEDDRFGSEEGRVYLLQNDSTISNQNLNMY